jgi:hypothetical protein
MHLAQDNDVVYTLTPDRSDQPFGKAVLPGRGWRGRLSHYRLAKLTRRSEPSRRRLAMDRPILFLQEHIRADVDFGASAPGSADGGEGHAGLVTGARCIDMISKNVTHGVVSLFLGHAWLMVFLGPKC